MRTSIKLLAALLCVLCGQTATVTIIQPAAVSAGDPLLPYLIKQGFEGTGYDNSESWTESGTGTIDEDEATVYANGSQSLEITSSATTDQAYASFTAQSTCYGHVMWRYASEAGTTDIINFRSSGSQRLRVTSSGSGALVVIHGTANASVTDSVPADTWVHIWFKYVQGTGADGAAELSWSTTTTRPTTGTKFTSLSNGSLTSTVDRIYLGSSTSETKTEYYDDCWIDEAGYPQP